MTVQWTVRAANDRSRDRAARVESLSACQVKRPVETTGLFNFILCFPLKN